MGRRLLSEMEESPSLREAHRLLDLPTRNSSPTGIIVNNNNINNSDGIDTSKLSKSEIQLAFLRTARRYHPDGQHRPNARPSAEQFRRCYEARRLLLAHHCGIFPRQDVGSGGSGRSSHYYYNYRHSNTATGGGGFPFRTLKLLTPKQNIMLRGAVFAVLAAGTSYDDWTRKAERRKKTSL